MKTRTFAAGLWFLAGWVAGGMVAFAAGLDPILSPLTATVLGGLVAIDPFKRIWTPRPALG